MAEVWTAQKERSNPLTLRFICWFAQKMPRCVTRLWLWPITLYFFLFAPKARFASRHYLKRVPGHKGSSYEVFMHLYTFASVVLDRVYFLTNRFDKFQITTQGSASLDYALASGRGVIALGTHLGSFEIMRCLANRNTQSLPLKILMYQDHNAMISRVLDELNPELAQSVINLAEPDALLQAKETLEQGYVVGMLGDRILPDEKSVRCNLLGDEVEMPAGPFSLALMLGVPVVQFYGIYEGGNRYSVHIELVGEAQKIAREKREVVIDGLTQQYVTNIETMIKRYPYNWFNFYDYWRDGK